MVRPQVADGRDDLHMWRIDTNVLNKQSRSDDKGWYPTSRVAQRLNNTVTEKVSMLRNVRQAL
jgi:hypothetical protein